MATQIVLAVGESILVDDSYLIRWADKGKSWQDGWAPSNYHYVIWNNLPGQNEIQTKDPSTGMMAGNTDLNATSDAVGSTTVADLLTWADVRKLQIEEAELSWGTAQNEALNNWNNDGKSEDDFNRDNTETESYWDWSKTWRDYDPNYS